MRHAQSTWNVTGRWQGWADPPLSREGRLHAAAAGRLSAGLDFGVVISSDLRRARETAEALAAAAGWPAPVTCHRGLREYDIGAWSGLTRDEIDGSWPGQAQRWRDGELPGAPGGERRVDFVARIWAALAGIAGAHRGDRVLVVAHGGVVRAVGGAAEGGAVGGLTGCWLIARPPGDHPPPDPAGLFRFAGRTDLLGGEGMAVRRIPLV